MIILWAKDEKYKEEKFQKYILDQRLISGIFVSNQSEAEWFYNENKERFPNSIHNLGTGEVWYYKEHDELLTKYAGETSGTLDDYFEGQLVWQACNVESNIYIHKKNIIIDETEPYYLELAQRLTFDSTFRVSISSYRNILFSFPVPKFLQSWIRLTRLRVYGWNSHLSTLKKVDKMFGQRHKNMNIHLHLSRKHFAELIRYAIGTQKTIMLYAGDDYEYDYPAFFAELENQLKISRLAKANQGSWI